MRGRADATTSRRLTPVTETASPLRLAAVLIAIAILAALLGTSVARAEGEHEHGGGGTTASGEPQTYHVCPDCPLRDLQAVVSTAVPGSRIEVHGGTYGQLTIDRDLQLIGFDNPVLDGQDLGSVLTATGADITLSGFTVRGTGTNLDHEDTAILVDSGTAIIENNRVEDALFGIYLKNAPDSVIRNNVVIQKQEVDVARRGDGIRVWYADRTLIEGNDAQHGRDVILWYSNGGVVRGNNFDHNRYGLHLMFSHDTLVEGNALSMNSIGLFAMYSKNLTVVRNELSNNHGPSGGGMGFKDVNGATVENNRFIDNQIGAQIDNSPLDPGTEHVWKNNVFAYNEAALGVLPSTRQNTFTDNAFIDNIQHVTVLGGGQIQDVAWSLDGRGNYWSDYAGYDANGDGVGDVPYKSQQLFESLMDEHPALRLFIFSPAATAIDFAARAFPAMRPQVKLEDSAPLMQPPTAVGLPPVARDGALTRTAWGGLGTLAALGVAILVVLARRPARRARGATPTSEGAIMALDAATGPTTAAATGEGAIVAVRSVTKRYGRHAAVDEMTFDVQPGEAIALWGPNGAGKTTILRCLLGITRFDGTIAVDGHHPLKDGRAVRERIGYVPQDLAPSAMTVAEMASFIATLKRAPAGDAEARLELLGIAAASGKTIAELSGGMRQRLALALALIGSPRILLLDEPTANLDAAGRADLIGLLRRLKREGMTLIFSSHRQDDVISLADRVLNIEAGRIVSELSPLDFAREGNRSAQLVLTLKNGHLREALETLATLGLRADERTKEVLAVEIGPKQKAHVLAALARQGVDIDDFDLEVGTWITQQ